MEGGKIKFKENKKNTPKGKAKLKKKKAKEKNKKKKHGKVTFQMFSVQMVFCHKRGLSEPSVSVLPSVLLDHWSLKEHKKFKLSLNLNEVQKHYSLPEKHRITK